MGLTSDGDIFTRNPTTTVTTGLTTFFEVFAGLLKDNTLREGAIALVPILVLGVVILLKNWKKEYEFSKGEKYYTSMIAELKDEYNSSETLKQRKQEIRKEISQHQKTLEKLRTDNIKIIVT
jgi:hypothetical protein